VAHHDRRCRSLGLSSPHAPWRRVARPLAMLFALQLSGIGCAARAPQLATPTHPAEIAPYFDVYQEQLEQQGISRAGAVAYVTGRSASPLPQPVAESGRGNPLGEDESAGFPQTSGNDVGNPATTALPPQAQASEAPFKIVEGVAEYRIGPGDLLLITTFLGPETPFPTTFRVQADGNVFIARFEIGTVPAAGLTPSELTVALSNAFRQYVPSGYVEARVQEYNAWRATLAGEIRAVAAAGPGSYPLEGRVTVSDFVYSHGGPTAEADLGDVRILRQGREIRVDLAAALSGTGDNPPVFAGDTVRVPSIEQGSSRMFIFGEVREPGVYTYTEGISVLDAIAQAGGYTQTAKRSAVYISRPSTGEVIPVNLDEVLGSGQAAVAPTLEPGDFVMVPFSPDRSQLIRDWVGIFGVLLSALTIIEVVRQD